ncbi:PREDICTED: uncharacterized protein LOC107353140 isoform X2 [Acropora digitifera]|uniref:uncharacterized protein LOC107353140 isoform X2 n=1 Tax=Acropora digitifera TaxID=70779 RepID=UPI000779FF0B|nr:PREDICTED: uncharacterized protein LOC107353140 isoform X2 [Acropora digitifera]
MLTAKEWRKHKSQDGLYCSEIPSRCFKDDITGNKFAMWTNRCSRAKQAQMNFMKNVSRTASSMCLLSTVSPLGASLVIAGSSSDLMEGSAGEDDGLVIGAWSDLEDL